MGNIVTNVKDAAKKTAETIAEAICNAVDAVGSFFTRNVGPGIGLMTAEQIEYPPISLVLAKNGRPELIDSMRSAVRSRNDQAIGHIHSQLVAIGLDHISEAFQRGIADDMKCSKSTCGKKLENIDELCYCPSAESQCHHNNSCCYSRGRRGLMF